MQRMSGVGRFLKFSPPAAEIVLLNKIWLQPWRKLRQRVRTAHPPTQPGAKATPEWRGKSTLLKISPQRLHNCPRNTTAGQHKEGRARVGGLEMGSAPTREKPPRRRSD